MICHEKSLTQNNFLPDKKFNVDRKRQLVACWKKVDGKLICQWVTASKRHNNTTSGE